MKRAVREALALRTAPPRAPELSQRGDLLWIDMQYLAPDPGQPREAFNEESIAELADNLSQVGVLTPLRVRPINDEGLHVIIDGERRWRAAQLAGIVEFPCLVEAADPVEAFYQAYLANLHREALSSIDAAVGLQKIREDFALAGDDDVARKMNKSVSWVRQMNAVLSLDPESRKTLAERHEPVAVAVSLRPQSPSERHQTLEAIAELPSRDRKLDFISRVNERRRAGQSIDEAIPAVQAALSAPEPEPESTNGSSSQTTPRPRTGRPRRLTLPFTWREISDGISMLEVAPSALATTRLAAHRTTTASQWTNAVVEDIATFRDACASSSDSEYDWDNVRTALLRVLSDGQDDEQAIA